MNADTLRAGMARLAGPAHRGLQLDITVFLVNLLVMRFVMGSFRELVGQAEADDPVAMASLFGLGVALMVLPPLGATLKRWSYHRRRGAHPTPGIDPAAGCLFNPIFYFCLQVIIWAAVNAYVMQRVYGNGEPSGGVFVGSLLAGLVLIMLHTWLVYRYFTPPSKPPAAFLRSHAAERIGDACLFTNMLVFQVFWNLLTFSGIGAPSGAAEVVGRLMVLVFLAMLLYFPPRMFYLAEDIGRRRTWLTILLANSPVIVRLVVGS